MAKHALIRDLTFYVTLAALVFGGYTFISEKFADEDDLEAMAKKVEKDCQTSIQIEVNSSSVSFGRGDSFKKINAGYVITIPSSHGRFRCQTDHLGNTESLTRVEALF